MNLITMLIGLIVNLLLTILDCIEYIIIFYIILGWFVMFGVLKNHNNPFLKVYIFLMSKIEPVFSYVRNHLPIVIMGLDFSPLIVFLTIRFIEIFITKLYLTLVNAIY